MKYSDAQMLSWLSDCSRIDHSGTDGGWSFERCIMTDGENPIGVADVRIAVRGWVSIDGLREQASIAMGVDRTLGENPFTKSPKEKKG
jgi:hypothetical protein